MKLTEVILVAIEPFVTTKQQKQYVKVLPMVVKLGDYQLKMNQPNLETFQLEKALMVYNYVI